ncbi:hypothetical protein N9D38_01645 [Rubripirellula sp.]|nr:hypothetical protein [Rubripirellula sp.]
MRIYHFRKLSIAIAVIAAVGIQTSSEAQRRSRTARSGRTVVPPVIEEPAAPAPELEAPAPPALGDPFGQDPLATDPFAGGLFTNQPRENATTPRVRTADRVIAAPDFAAAPLALETLALPAVDTSEYIADEASAVALGKALFWDQQMASDGFVSCASCHYHFGVDVRTKNTVAPGGFASAQSPDFTDDSFYGPNEALASSMFPFHKKVDPLKKTIDFPNGENLPGENIDPNDHEANILSNNDDVVGSSGISRRLFDSLIEIDGKCLPQERGSKEALGSVSEETKLFTKAGSIHRAVTGRNAPTTYGAAYHTRLFWDGRGENQFNGVNTFGDTDPTARVWKANADGTNPLQVSISIKNAALASQATGPVLDSIETSFIGRSFPLVGRKMLGMNPLATQDVHVEDSVLGGGYLNGKTYADLVRAAFKPEWYQAESVGDGEHTQMEANFSLFWGLSIMMYERTLIPDNSRYDQFARSGFRRGFTDQEKEGLSIFLNEGKCINCHHGSFFAAVTGAEAAVESMAMQFGNVVKTYDSGFYNIGVTPTVEDLGIGGVGFGATPLSETLRSGVDPSLAAVNGAFKSNTLRNIEYTGPYMHNGSMKSLREVVEFYARGGNHANEADRAPDVDGIKILREDPTKIDALVAFLRTLTDEDAARSAAPFDHPSLVIANGCDDADNDIPCVIESTGRNGLTGNRRLREFDEILADGGLTTENRTAVEH